MNSMSLDILFIKLKILVYKHAFPPPHRPTPQLSFYNFFIFMSVWSSIKLSGFSLRYKPLSYFGLQEFISIQSGNKSFAQSFNCIRKPYKEFKKCFLKSLENQNVLKLFIIVSRHQR